MEMEKEKKSLKEIVFFFDISFKKKTARRLWERYLGAWTTEKSFREEEDFIWVFENKLDEIVFLDFCVALALSRLQLDGFYWNKRRRLTINIYAEM